MTDNLLEYQSPERGQLDSEAVMVHQGGFAVIDLSAHIKKIGTAGLGPCIATVMYHPSGILAVAHFDAMTELNSSLIALITQFEHAGLKEQSEIETTFIGGDEESVELRQELTETFKRFGIRGINDLNPRCNAHEGPRRFVVDVRDGRIQAGLMPAYPEGSLARSANRRLIIGLVQRPLRINYTDIRGTSQGIE